MSRHKHRSWRDRNWLVQAYACRWGHLTTTVQINAGEPPDLLPCPSCGLEARALPEAQERPLPPFWPAPAHEWYRPFEHEIERLARVDPGRAEHAARGGLLLRPRTNLEPLGRN